MIKLLIGGSPCTFWSIAQKNGRETEAEGMGWELFKNYLVAKEKFKPDFFLYENNKSASQAIKDQISVELGVDLMYINSALVSAQNRQRFYAFNWEVDQPEDRGIVLRDILETGTDLSQNEKSYCLTASYSGACAWNTLERAQRTMVAEPVGVTKDGKAYCLSANYANGSGAKIGNYAAHTLTKGCKSMVAEPVAINTTDNGDKARTLMAGYYKYGTATIITNDGFKGGTTAVDEPICPIRSGKARCLTAGCANKGSKHILESNFSENPNKQTWDSVAESVAFYAIPCELDENGNPTKAKRVADGKIYMVYEINGGLITIKDKQYSIKLPDGFYIIRKLTPIECERLQTLPDGYTAAVSDTQRYKGLGNGWTAEVIIHILSGALKDAPKDEEIVVLSMYDGIGTGRYCLDKMGFTNVKYFAYEIDKYAMQIAMKNYPDIIQMGDAFDLRRPDWTIGY